MGFPTVKAVLANRLAPGLLDRFLARVGYQGQLTDEASDPDSPGNLFEPVEGPYGAHRRFDDRARTGDLEIFTSRHRDTAWAIAFMALAAGGALLVKRRNNNVLP